MSTSPTLLELCERATPGPWFLGPRSPYHGYRYAIRPDAEGHGWDVAHVCNGEDADANAQLIARCSPQNMKQVREALEGAERALCEANGSAHHPASIQARRALALLDGKDQP